MNDFVKVYASRNSSNRYEFTIEEKTGLEIVMATDSSGDRSAWITSFNMFIKMDKLTLNLDSFSSTDISNNAVNIPTEIEIKQTKNDMEFIKNELLYIKMHLKPTHETDLLSKISNQLEKQNALLEQIISPNTGEVKSVIPDKSVGYLISKMNDKLTRLLSAVDYVTDRVSTSLKRDQDIIKTQNQLANHLDQHYNELKSLKNMMSENHNVPDVDKRHFPMMHVGKVNSSDTITENENS